MNTESVWNFIEEIDHQMSLVSSKSADNNHYKPLLELRNHILLKYKPDPNLDWTIKDKKLAKALEKADWSIKWTR